jgi:integrase
MAKLTKRFIDGLRSKPTADVFAWDGELRGFGVRIKPSGAGSYLVQYRTAQGRTRRFAFGKIGTLAPDEARARAKRLLADVEGGSDPSAQRHEARTALTVMQLCELYLGAARAGLVITRFRKSKRASTVAIDEGRVARHIVPLIGSQIVQTLNRATIQRMADAIAAGKTAGTFVTKARGKACVTGGPGTAARVVEFFGGVWTWAEKRGLVSGPNPAHGVEKHRGEAKDRVLSPAEMAALGKVLGKRAIDCPAATAALRLIALTGLRREEACALRWREIDYVASCLRLEVTKTGRSIRPIGQTALQFLSTLPRRDGEWVFPNRNASGSADLKKTISAIFDAAGLADARAHDLRRSFASIAAGEGYGDATIAELLGHARRGVTARHYIRRPDAALTAAASCVSERMAALLEDRGSQVGALQGHEMTFGLVNI